MTKKIPAVKLYTKNPEGYPTGTVLEEFMDGSKEITYPDKTKEFIDAQGKAIVKALITDAQIEAWKKMPKEEATAKILKLIDDTTLTVAEKRFNLDAIWKLVELNGGLEPVRNKGDRVIALRVNFINASGQAPQMEQNNSVDVEARVVEQ